MSIFTYIKKHSVVTTLGGVVVVVLMIIAGRVVSRGKAISVSESSVKSVILAPVKNFRSDASLVAADGVVESVSQADIKSQLSSPISGIYVSIGDFVRIGQVIAELQNADIKAQLDQARASLALARGQYDTGAVSVDAARKSAIDKIRDGYLKADDAINTQIGQFLFNRNSDTPQLASLITDSRLYNSISIQWSGLTSIISDWKVRIDSLSDKSTDLEVDSALSLSQKNITLVTNLLDSISMALSDVTKSSTSASMPIIGTWKQVVSATRNSISSTAIGITGAQSTLANARSSHTSPGQAQISVAEAGVKNLEAQLAKTIIVSPISGRISALPLRAGELATPGQLISTIVGTGGLQIKAYVSGEDLYRIKKGASVSIRGSVKGSVVSIAPSVSQLNKKAEIKISIENPDLSGLVVGESVQTLVEASEIASTLDGGVYVLPIQNVKIVPGDAYVFVVDESMKVKKVPVILGNVKGDFIEVKSGLNDNMSIISPVYEIDEGESVRVQQ